MELLMAAPAENGTEPSPSGTPEELRQAVRKCADWFSADKAAKEPILRDMLEDDKLYRGDHWDLIGPDGYPLRDDAQKRARANVVENIAFALIEGLVSEFSQDVDIIDFPQEKGDEDAANMMTDLKKFIAYKNHLEEERQHWLRHYFKYGTAIWEHVWDPEWKGGRGPNRWAGEIRWRDLHPQAAYPDARCRKSIHDGRRFHKAVYVTLEELRERYPEAAKNITAEAVSAQDLLLEEDETSEYALEDQALLVESWYIGRPLIHDEDTNEDELGTGLHVIWWANEGQQVYLAHANYVYYEPGATPRFPFTWRVCYPRENSVWGYSEGRFLKSPQIVANKTGEIILEAHMHHAVGQTFYNSDALTPEQEKFVKQNGTIPGMWFAVKNVDKIDRRFGQGAPASLQNEMTRLQRAMETIVGRFDISQGRTPGSVTAFRALDLLSQRAQVRLRSKEMAMTGAYQEAGSYINRLITLYYTETRQYRILGVQQNEPTRYGEFNTQDIQKVWLRGTTTVIPFRDFQPTEGMVEGEHYEVYSPEFDSICRVSTTLPTDRVFYMEMAKELFAQQLIDEETFWYVLDHGKFPPFEDLLQKAQERAQAQGQPAPGVMPGAGNLDPGLQALLSQAPVETQMQFANLPPEAQAQVAQELLAGGGGAADASQAGYVR